MKKIFGFPILIFLAIAFVILFANCGFGQPMNGMNDPLYEPRTTPPPPPPPKPKPEQPVAPKQPLVEILTAIDRQKFVGSQNIVFKASIVFYQQINPFWEELPKINFSPFIIEKMIPGERKMFDREKDLSRDVREATFLLSLPSSNACGAYTIPSFSIGYSYFQGKTEIKGNAKSKPIKTEKIPILVTCSTDKDVLTIGEINTFRLIIKRENYIHILNHEFKNIAPETGTTEKEEFARWLKSLEIRNQKITNLDKPEFPSFKVLGKNAKTEKWGTIIEETFEYRFAFYELGGKEFQLPIFHIWYLNKSKEEKAQKPKEIITPPLANHINLVVRQSRQSLEGLKSPEPGKKENIYYFGYAPLALGGLLFLISAISITTSSLRSRGKKSGSAITAEPPDKIKARLMALVNSKSTGRGSLVKARNDLFRLLGSISGIPIDQCEAKTSPQIAENLKQVGITSAESLKPALATLDRMIQNCDRDQDLSEARSAINAIINSPDVARLTKKKKKFLIF